MSTPKKRCPICARAVKLILVSGFCPRIACTCGLEFSKPEIRDERDLIEVWEHPAYEKELRDRQHQKSIDRDARAAWFDQVSQKLWNLVGAEVDGTSALGKVMNRIEYLHTRARAADGVLHAAATERHGVILCEIDVLSTAMKYAQGSAAYDRLASRISKLVEELEG